MRGRGFLRLVGLLGLLVGTGALVFAGQASAKEVRFPLGAFGSANQPSFTEPRGLAVDQESHDVYAIGGRNEVQRITVAATAGQFKLKAGSETTKDLPFDAETEEVESALRELFCPAGGACVSVLSGKGNGTGSNPYVIGFGGSFATTDVEQIECVPGSTPLSGGGASCSALTTINGVNGSITRYHADGTPSNFSAVGSNAIDGLGPEPDLTPQAGLHFNSARIVQMALDESSGESKGEIYVTQAFNEVLDIFGPGGEYLGQLSEYEQTPGNPGTLQPLGLVCGVAVDAAGDVYLSDAESGIHKYDPAGKVVANTDSVANFTSVSEPCTLAAGRGETAGFLFADSGGGELFKLDATTGEVRYEVSKNNTIVTVDPESGHIFTAAGSAVNELDASGPASASLRHTIAAPGHVSGVAVDGTSDNVYLSREGATNLDVYGPLVIVPDVLTEAATEITGTSATLNGVINAASGPDASCHFQYTTEAAYQADKAISGHDGFAGAQSAPCEPAGPFSGAAANAVSAEASSLSPESKYEFRIVGENENGFNVGERESTAEVPCPGEFVNTCPESFETLGKPVIEGGLASEITTTTARISGKVNSRGLPTTFAVQYLTQADFEVSGYAGATTTPGKKVGSGIGFIEVSNELASLEPATIYHFRLIAENESGSAEPGEDRTFTTFAQATGLPGGRAYEEVSPAVKLGEVFPPEAGGLRVGLGGSCRSCVPGWQKARMPMQVSPDGNAIAYEGNPFTAGLASGPNEYIANRGAGGWATTPLSGPEFEDDFTVGFKAFSVDLNRGVLYQIEPSLTPDAPANYANLYLWQAGAALEPLITKAPPSRSAGTKGENFLRLTFAGANAGTPSSPPLSHLVFQANDALTEEVPGIAPKAPLVGAKETDLYEWSGGQLHLVNVLPGNNATAANAVIGSGDLVQTIHDGNGTFDFDHAISDDGSRVFWSEQPGGQVYVREGGTSTTKVLDPGKFLTATPDGSKVLLSNGHIFNLEDEGTSDLTGGQGGFEGILGTSEDLSRVYFVDTKALTPPDDENANDEAAEEGEFNLYLSEDGNNTFIGILSNSTSTGDIGAWHPSPANRLAQVSPDGRYLVFESVASLTGYDNRYRHAKPGAEGCRYTHGSGGPETCVEVFEYDAAQNSLNCASCNPTGQRPLGQSNLSLIQNSPEDFPQPHNLPPEGEGRLFFESQDVLSAADENGHTQDVYEWLPNGVGNCEMPRGCISLISAGRGPEGPHAFNNDSQFVDASPTGGDVFFTTWTQLVPFDKDNLMDLYDARVGGGFEFSAQEPCLGEACKGISSAAPELQSPGTAGFSEAVSVPKPGCKKGAVKKRGRCVTKKKKHHHKRAAKHGRGGTK